MNLPPEKILCPFFNEPCKELGCTFYLSVTKEAPKACAIRSLAKYAYLINGELSDLSSLIDQSQKK